MILDYVSPLAAERKVQLFFDGKYYVRYPYRILLASVFCFDRLLLCNSTTTAEGQLSTPTTLTDFQCQASTWLHATAKTEKRIYHRQFGHHLCFASSMQWMNNARRRKFAWCVCALEANGEIPWWIDGGLWGLPLLPSSPGSRLCHGPPWPKSSRYLVIFHWHAIWCH